MRFLTTVGELVVAIDTPDDQPSLSQEARLYSNTSGIPAGGVHGILKLEVGSFPDALVLHTDLRECCAVQLVDSRVRFLDEARGELRTFCLEGEIPTVLVKLELVQLLLFLLSRRNGLVIHAAGVGMAGLAVIVAGPSGVGKSTAASLLGGHLLSDDMVVLTDLDAVPRAHSTTFGGRSDGAVSVPLGAVLFPRHAQSFSLRRLSRTEAFSRYQFEHGSYLSHTLPRCRRNLATLALALFEKVPSFEMSFPRDFVDREALLHTIRTGLS